MGRFLVALSLLFFFNLNDAIACSLEIEEDSMSAELEAVARAGFLGYGRKVLSSSVQGFSYEFYSLPTLNDSGVAACPGVISTATVTVTYETETRVCTEKLGVIADDSGFRILKDYSVEGNYSCKSK